MSSPHTQHYPDIRQPGSPPSLPVSRTHINYADPPQPSANKWPLAASVAVGFVVVAAALTGAAVHMRASDARVAAELASPVVLPCRDPLTGQDASVRAIDEARQPGTIQRTMQAYGCKANQLNF